MKKYFFIILSLLLLAFVARSQSTFKAGWNTYQTGKLFREYVYTYSGDTSKLIFTDSSQVFISPDSLVTLTLHYLAHDRSVYKTLHYFNQKKQILKTEEYKDDNMMMAYEWRYDEKERKNYYYEDNKQTGNNYRKTYEYALDRKSGEIIVTESSYYNGRIEFYTKDYYNKHSVKYKEVRLNDNNKDVVHIESYTYDDNGQLRERSVYFPEWKVTRKFTEPDTCIAPDCRKNMPVGTADKVVSSTRMPYIKKLLARNMMLLAAPKCERFEYTFKNFTNCEIIVSSTNVNHTQKVVFRYREKI